VSSPLGVLDAKAYSHIFHLPCEQSVVDPALNFRNFGKRVAFSGPVTTIKAYESNPLVISRDVPASSMATRAMSRLLAWPPVPCAGLQPFVGVAPARHGALR
jgi:hypothetical protein